MLNRNVSVKEESRVGAQVTMFFSCVGRQQHDLAMHQVSGTLEGRKGHGRCLGSGGHGSNPGPGHPPPPPPWNPHLTVVRPPFTEDGIYVKRGEGTWPRSHTGILIWVLWSPDLIITLLGRDGKLVIAQSFSIISLASSVF